MRNRDNSEKAPALRANIISIDTEATGLDPYHGDRIFAWAYHTSKGEYGFMQKTPASLIWMKNLSTRRVINILGNTKSL